MVTKIKTEKFNFNINLMVDSGDATFEIIAFDNTNNTRSSITNLNFILSEIVEDIMGEDGDYESSIECSVAKGKKLHKLAVKLFERETFLSLLNKALAEDIACGEWSKI